MVGGKFENEWTNISPIEKGISNLFAQLAGSLTVSKCHIALVVLCPHPDLHGQVPRVVRCWGDDFQVDMRIERYRAGFPREHTAIDADGGTIGATGVVRGVYKMKVGGIVQPSVLDKERIEIDILDISGANVVRGIPVRTKVYIIVEVAILSRN